MNSRQGTNLIHVRRPRPNAWGAPPTATPQELNGNDSTTILHAAKTTTGKPTENHNPRRFIRHKSHAARKTNPENRSGMVATSVARPGARVDWAFPGSLLASLVFMRVSGMPAR